MTSQELVGHLLEVEQKAQSIVDTAQAEADKQVMESAQKLRNSEQEEITKKLAALDSSYEKTLDEAKTAADKELVTYKSGLGSMETHYDDFATLAGSYFGAD
jgi:vacuolar-type H+-ATPase subunit E/Vma4